MRPVENRSNKVAAIERRSRGWQGLDDPVFTGVRSWVVRAFEAAFAHFRGRCEFLLYDRMRTVVLGTSRGKPRLNPTFAAFASHWGFSPRLCQPYRARTFVARSSPA